MKMSFFTLSPALVIIAVTISSCAENKCCTLLTAKVCESDMPIGYNNWDGYAGSLEAAGYVCD
jgi:D-arabinose 1-dehydrogenase-like Zn-dependent alcohol dehydrogenase